MATARCTCGAIWTGLKIEHCKACHQTFAATEPGDAHRVGRFEPDERRCLTPDEMTKGGMWSTENPYSTLIWHGRIEKKGRRPRRHPHETLAGVPQTDTQGTVSTRGTPDA
jgi:hypothetical protein